MRRRRLRGRRASAADELLGRRRGAPRPRPASCRPDDARGVRCARRGAPCAGLRAVDGRRTQLLADHAQRHELVTLHVQGDAQRLDVLRGVHAVATGRPLGLDDALVLQEAQLGDRDVREFVAEQVADLADAIARRSADAVLRCCSLPCGVRTLRGRRSGPDPRAPLSVWARSCASTRRRTSACTCRPGSRRRDRAPACSTRS